MGIGTDGNRHGDDHGDGNGNRHVHEGRDGDQTK